MSRGTDPGTAAGPFETAFPHLLGLAYRILGSRADAEDAVQDTYIKWLDSDQAAIENPAAWLTTVCTRRCLDLSRAAHRTRVDYVGAWLPEPIQATNDPDAERDTERAESLTTAFLLMLERLSPKERAAYLLREVFDTDYPDIAESLELREAACRKLVSRAKTRLGQTEARHTPPRQRQETLLSTFQQAVTTGSAAALTVLLSEDVKLSADGGGKVTTILEPVEGRCAVEAFLTVDLHRYWAKHEWLPVDLNGTPGFILTLDDVTDAAVTFAFDKDGNAEAIFIVRNPDKIAALDPVQLH